MIPIQTLAMNIPGEEMTEIIEEEVRDLIAELGPESEQVYNDGIFPGTKTLSGKTRLAGYLTMTDPSDFALLFDDDYLMRLRAGLDNPPVSPYWLNLMSVPDSFERLRRDFMRLIQQKDQAVIRDPSTKSY